MNDPGIPSSETLPVLGPISYHLCQHRTKKRAFLSSSLAQVLRGREVEVSRTTPHHGLRGSRTPQFGDRDPLSFEGGGTTSRQEGLEGAGVHRGGAPAGGRRRGRCAC